MELKIENETSVKDVQKQFAYYYPNLQLQFLVASQMQNKNPGKIEKAKPEQPLKQIGNFYKPVQLPVNTSITVSELLQSFKQLGLTAQVSRKSGSLWIETAFTDDWTLERQNNEGLLFSTPHEHLLTEKIQEK
jgi:hypothetical protein